MRWPAAPVPISISYTDLRRRSDAARPEESSRSVAAAESAPDGIDRRGHADALNAEGCRCTQGIVAAGGIVGVDNRIRAIHGRTMCS